MKKVLIVFSVIFIALSYSFAQNVAITPEPLSITTQKGNFELSSKTNIVYSNSQFKNSATYLANYIQKYYNIKTSLNSKTIEGSTNIVFKDEKLEGKKGAYNLQIQPNKITVGAPTAEGIFYGIQSLVQLFPTKAVNKTIILPTVSINDAPRFDYRGMHLDVSRHFFGVATIKRYLDFMALHKLNYFHWHLTDDQGWRIEIKKYPALTTVGSKRNGTIVRHFPGKENDHIPYGGFYTQEQIKEVVAYATKRYITVVPEIEMPGHASAALAAYPALGCTGGPYKVEETWGIFDDVFCAGNDATFNFLQDVLDEVMPLFPGSMIHVGGDECPKTRWKTCAKCQKRMHENSLKDEHALQSYFVQRIEKYINKKGKKIIGWDEILEGGLAPNAMVMSWRGENGGIEAAKQKHTVIMTPVSYCYFDYAANKKEDSLTIGNYLPTQKVYEYEPIPAELSNTDVAKWVLGAQGNIWTEYITNEIKLDYMVFPRLSALSEVLWTGKDKKSWKRFVEKSPQLYEKYALWKINGNKLVE